MNESDKKLIMMAQSIKSHCRELGEINLGGNCCNGCIFSQGGCVFNTCPEEWRISSEQEEEK